MNHQLGILGVAAITALGVVISTARSRVRRRPHTESSDARLEQISRQIAALQQSLDAMAVEVERVGEGLRFTTKVLAQRNDAEERADGGTAS
jgi:hypothetical protein